jgi:hypothetical protein
MTDNISAFPQRKPAGCRAVRMLKLKNPPIAWMSGFKERAWSNINTHVGWSATLTMLDRVCL